MENLATDPLPPVTTGDARIGFERLATLPASSQAQPTARVQQVVPVPGLDGALAALDTRGVIWIVEDGAVRDTPLVTLTTGNSGFVDPGAEAGLRSIAFHPDFAESGADGFGKIYIAYSATAASAQAGAEIFGAPGSAASFHDAVAEFTVADPSAPVIDTGSRRELLRVEQPFGNHNFGQLGFNPEAAPGDADYGMLYLSTGDGGGGNDPLNAAENLGLIYGKILRIHPLADGGEAYTIPPGNPFAGTQGALPEILAYGFRNPQQFSFADGRLFTGDIGQSTIEEINIVRAGGHYGWDDREGTLVNADGVIGALPPGDAALGLQYPLTQYDHEEIDFGNAAVAGGFVYRGDAIPGLQDSYVFANFPTGRLFYLPLDGLDAALADGRIAPEETRAPLDLRVIGSDGHVTRFSDFAGNPSGRVDLRLGQTPDGELLAFSKQTGEIFRLTAPPPGSVGDGLSIGEVRTVAYLYEAALDRNGDIDLPGLNFWIDQRENGLSETETSAFFLGSMEFETRFGDPDTLDDATLVSLLYQNVLNRPGDAAGLAFWTGIVSGDGFGRADLLLAFAESVEHTDSLDFVDTLTETEPGLWAFA